MFDDKGFITFIDDEFKVTINYLNMGDYLIGLTLKDSYKVEHFNNHPKLQAANGIRSNEYVDVSVNISYDLSLINEIFEKMTTLKHNHFKDFDERLVAVIINII